MLENNKFEIIFDENFDGPDLYKLYEGQKNWSIYFKINFLVECIGEIEEDNEMHSDGDSKPLTTRITKN